MIAKSESIMRKLSRATAALKTPLHYAFSTSIWMGPSPRPWMN